MAPAAPAAAHAPRPGVVSHLDSAPPQPAALKHGGGSPTATAANAQPGSSMLPAEWCGDPHGPGFAGALANPGAPSIQLVYAYPADAPNGVGEIANALQGDVSIIDRFVADQAGQRKTLRFAMGTRCGNQYVDLMVVRLPEVGAAYLIPQGVQALVRADAIVAQLHALLPHGVAGKRNYLVFVDGVANQPVGMGEQIVRADVAGASNPNNDGGRLGLVFAGPVPQGAAAYEPSMLLHEASHTLGAVQDSAPHATPGGHCYDGADVMCYEDGSGGVQQQLCAPLPGSIEGHYDCSGEDYFNPQPQPGSYLATHWNLYDSAFMAGCRELPAACAPATADPAPPAAAPVASKRRRGARRAHHARHDRHRRGRGHR